MSQRRYEILRHVIQEFIQSAHPVSSKNFTETQEFQVSSATIRNEMNRLEKEGLLCQPHTSAGRIPTLKGYQHFVNELMDISQKDEQKLLQDFQDAHNKHFLLKTKEKVYDGVSILSKLTENIAFATIPENKQTLFLGFAKLLQQPEFAQNMSDASGVVEVLENGFFDAIKNLEIGNEVEIHIGENDIFPQIQSCSIMCTKYQHLGFEGILGIVGPVRMDYAKNKILIEYTKQFIEGQKLLQS